MTSLQPTCTGLGNCHHNAGLLKIKSQARRKLLTGRAGSANTSRRDSHPLINLAFGKISSTCRPYKRHSFLVPLATHILGLKKLKKHEKKKTKTNRGQEYLLIIPILQVSLPMQYLRNYKIASITGRRDLKHALVRITLLLKTTPSILPQVWCD